MSEGKHTPGPWRALNVQKHLNCSQTPRLQLRLRELHLAGQDINKISRIACQAADRLDALEAERDALEAERDALKARTDHQDTAIEAWRDRVRRNEERISDLEDALRGLQSGADKLLTALTFAEDTELPFGSFAEQRAVTETALAAVRNLIGKPLGDQS